MSLKTSIEKQLVEATNIESSLKTVKSEAESAKLRFKLCEIFHDIILEDCTTALRKDVPGRLWYSCFYKRIGEMRNRIVKDKGRVKKRRANGEDVGEHQKRLAKSEEGLKKFLSEALAFYKYFIDELQGMIMPPSSQTQLSQYQASQTQSQLQARSQSSQFSRTSSSTSLSKSAMKNVVPTIHKLYIHMGDLHRYDMNFSLAEQAYLNASSLAPGKGNPYNQLGVVAQLKEAAPGGHPLPAVAFYWYCRSLAATDGAFETSDGNVKRLFQANEKWLEDKGGDFEGGLKKSLEGLDNQQAKQMKSLASRAFLSRFVKFHGSLYQKKCLDSLRGKLIHQLGEILDENPFGDSLLIKMVAINAFSVWRCLQGSDTSNEVSATVYVFMLQFGGQLCLYLQTILEKTKVKLESGGKCGNIRILGPLVLLSEYVSEVNQSKFLKDLDTQPFVENVNAFWSSIASVAKIITESSHLSRLTDDIDQDDDVSDATSTALPDDFKALSKGFIPYVFLDEKNTQNSKGATYLLPEDAVDALGLHLTQTQSQMSQRSKKSFSSEKSNVWYEAETKLKLARFKAFISKHVESGELDENNGSITAARDISASEQGQALVGGTLITSDAENMSQGRFSVGEDDDKSSSVSVSEEDGRDVLVYKDSGQGKPALLVPSALLLGEHAEEKDDGSDLLKLSAMIDIDSVQKKAPLADDLTDNLLNPSAIFHRSTTGIININTPETDTVEESKVESRATLDNQILPPMPASKPVLDEKVPVRPPPGFQPAAFCPVPVPPRTSHSAPQASNIPPMTSFGGINLNNYTLPGHEPPTHQANMTVPQPHLFPSSSHAPPGFQSSQSHSYNAILPPPTSNPFVSSNNDLGSHHTSRLTRSYGLNSSTTNAPHVPSFLHNQSTVNPSFAESSGGGGIDLDSDLHDPFGLRSLGIFSDEKPQSSHQETNYRLPQTSNPFAFK